jgi:hypothetical protein
MKIKKNIPKSIRNLVWNKYIGEKKGNGLCKCCKKKTISQMDFECGHIISEYNGGKTIVKNLIPICKLCNTSMGRMNMYDFIKKHGLNQRKKVKKNITKTSKTNKKNLVKNIFSNIRKLLRELQTKTK